MTREQIELVRTSWEKANADPDRTAAHFYTRLTGTDPGIARLFRETDMGRQGLRFMQMLDAAVRHVDRPPEAGTGHDDWFATLGRQHAVRGVLPEHYQAFGDALVWSLKRVLGAEFTPAHEEAWWALYAHVEQLMREAPAAARPAP
jgi:nitric oxide dioxygenase